MLITLVRLGEWLKSLHKIARVNAMRLAQLNDIKSVEESFSY